MIEKVYSMSTTNEKVMEKVLFDENLHYLHMVFNKNEGTPQHNTNGNVYMTVVRGTLTLTLGEQEPHTYPRGTLLKIPYNTKMTAENLHDEVLELFVVKAPAPNM